MTCVSDADQQSNLRAYQCARRWSVARIAYIKRFEEGPGSTVSNTVSLTMNRWTGKVAVVTGASVGIGAAISKDLVKESVKVVGLARRKDKLQEITNELGKNNFFPIVCDLRSEDDIVKAFAWVQENLGGADILINNAGVNHRQQIIDSKLDDYRKILDTNVIAPAICAREFVKSAKTRNIAGHIINISSIAGHVAEIVSVPIGMYAASKYALTALAVELRHELADTDIKVTNISPGAVTTDMLSNFIGDPDVLSNVPALTPANVSDVVMYALGTPPNVEIKDILFEQRSRSGSLQQSMTELNQKKSSK